MSSAASPVRWLSIDEAGPAVHVCRLSNLTAGMSYSSQLLPAEDAAAVWLLGTVAGMTYKDQCMCQNTVGKSWVQMKAIRQTAGECDGSGLKHCLHSGLSIKVTVNVLHSAGGIEHNVKQNCSATHH